MNIYSYLLFLAVSLGCFSCNLKNTGSTGETDSAMVPSSQIRSGTDTRSGLGWANAHAPIIAWIKFRGIKYGDLFGVYPYYVELPDLHSIVCFQNKKNITHLILINTLNGSVRDISGDWGGYGYGLCRKDEDFKDEVYVNQGGRSLTISSITPERKYTAHVDLNKFSKTGEIVQKLRNP